MKQKKKIGFFGSGPYALLVFKELIKAQQSISIVVTKNDKELIQLARTSGLKIIKFSNNWKQINEAAKLCDIGLVASFNAKIPNKTLKIPSMGFYNIHPSLLPRHRGPAPVVSEIFAGDKYGGVTIYKMDHKIDHGPILEQYKYQNSTDMDAEDIYKYRFTQGAKLFIKKIPDIEKAKLVNQRHKRATYSSMLRKSDGLLRLVRHNYSVQKVYDMMKAYKPWPGVYLFWRDKNHKKIRLELVKGKIVKNEYQPSKHRKPFITAHNKLFLDLNDNRKLLQLLEIKPEGKKNISAKEFINGYLN
jgi:methionyl-tRNA formyltransferase